MLFIYEKVIRIFIKLIKRLLIFAYNILLKNIPSANTPKSRIVRMRVLILQRFLKSCGRHVNIQAGVKLEGISNISIGDYSGIGERSHISASGQAPVIIGAHVMMASEVLILTSNHNTARDSLMMRQGFTAKPVTIGNDVWIGRRAIILPGATIADGCVIAAGAVVTSGATEPYGIYGGAPARKIKTRM